MSALVIGLWLALFGPLLVLPFLTRKITAARVPARSHREGKK